MLLPAICSWAEEQERYVLERGVPLGKQSLRDAAAIGVKHPEKVRLHAVERIPLPFEGVLGRIAEKIGLVSEQTIARTFQYGIYIRTDFWGDRKLAAHELAHTAQYERLGGIRPFLYQYLTECLTCGYPWGQLELEAKRIADEVVGEGLE